MFRFRNRAGQRLWAAALVLSTAYMPPAAAAVPSGCDAAAKVAELRGILEDSAQLESFRKLREQIEVAREKRGADQPRWYERIRFNRFLVREYLAKGNEAAVISQIIPASDAVLSAYVTVKRSGEALTTIIGLTGTVKSSERMTPELVRELTALMTAAARDGIKVDGSVNTSAEAVAVLEATYAKFEARRDSALRDLGLNYDNYTALVKELESKFTSAPEGERSVQERIARSALERTGLDRVRKLAPELVGRLGEPKLDAITKLIESSPVAVEARLTAMLKAEQGARFFGTIWQIAVLNHGAYAELIAKYFPTWMPVARMFKKVATDNLYFERHFSVIDQILPSSPRDGMAEPAPAEVYKFLLEKSSQHGTPLLISFFRRKAGTDWPERLVEHVKSLTTAEGKDHAKIFEGARNCARTLGAMPEFQRGMRGEQIAAAVIQMVFVMALTYGGVQGVQAAVGDGRLTGEDLERLLREGEEGAGAVSRAAEGGDATAREGLALLGAAARTPLEVTPTGGFLDGYPVM